MEELKDVVEIYDGLNKDSLRELVKVCYGYTNVEHLKLRKHDMSFVPDKGRRTTLTYGDLRVDTMVKFKEAGVDVNYLIKEGSFELTFLKSNLELIGKVTLDNAKVTVERKFWLEALYVASKVILETK